MKNRKQFVSILALIMAGVMVLSLILSLIPAAHAASSGELRNQINELRDQQQALRQEMADLQDQYKKNEDEIADIIARKILLDQEIFLMYNQIDNINEQISAFALLIADKQDELEAAQARFADLNDEHRERIRIMEEEGNLSYWEVLFKANSFADLLDRLNMIQEIAAADRRRLEELSDAADAVQEARDQLQAEMTDLEATHQELAEAYQELEEKKLEAEATLAELIEKGKSIEGFFASFENQEADLMTQIAQKEQEYNDAKHQEWLQHMATATTAPKPTPEPTKPAQPEQTKPQETKPQETKPGETKPEETKPQETKPEETKPEETKPEETKPEETKPKEEGWIRPCSYTKLTSPFGNRDAPTEGASTYHQGVDLAGPEGTPIYAARSGTVTTATRSNSAGFYVSINHGDGFSSIYMHMTTYTVSAGQSVTQGQLIGYMGSTGISTGPHLHFGISLNGTYVNPAIYVPL